MNSQQQKILQSYYKGRLQWLSTQLWWTPLVSLLGFSLGQGFGRTSILLSVSFTLLALALTLHRSFWIRAFQIGSMASFAAFMINTLSPHDGNICTGHVCVQVCFTLAFVCGLVLSLGLHQLRSYLKLSSDCYRATLAVVTVVSGLGCMVVGTGAILGIALGFITIGIPSIVWSSRFQQS